MVVNIGNFYRTLFKPQQSLNQIDFSTEQGLSYTFRHFQLRFVLSSIGLRSCEITMKEKTPLSHKVMCFKMLDFETSNSKLEVSKSNSWKITSFSKTIYVTSEGAVSHNVLYYQPLPITRYQVRFMLIIILSNYQQCPLPLCSCNRGQNLRWTEFEEVEHILYSSE